jgi:acetyl-CoA carboxylase carboxyltransferase component
MNLQKTSGLDRARAEIGPALERIPRRPASQPASDPRQPWRSAARGFIDDMIMSHGTRRRIARALRWLADKRLQSPWKKHVNIPLWFS